MDCLASPVTGDTFGCGARALPCIAQLARDHPRRGSLEQFVAAVYLRRYDARIVHFAEQLVALHDGAGKWLAAAGYTRAGDGRLFVEHYLDRPIEEALGARLGLAVARSQVVETGNLAAVGCGAARAMIGHMGAILGGLQVGWVVCTCTRTLLNSFLRLGLAPIALAPADPRRLPDRGRSWGSYYQTDPVVMGLDVAAGVARLRSQYADARC